MPGEIAASRIPARHAVEIYSLASWIFNDPHAAISESSITAYDEVATWLRQPGRTFPENETPIASLRLICCTQRVSMAAPFDPAVLKAVHEALGIPESHTYLTKLNAGTCGKYLVARGEFGEFFSTVKIKLASAVGIPD